MRAWAAEERAWEAAEVGTFPGVRPGFVPRAACHMLPMYGQLKVDPESSMSLPARKDSVNTPRATVGQRVLITTPSIDTWKTTVGQYLLIGT